MIMEVIDLPPSHILAEASRRKLFFDSKNVPRPLNAKMFKKRRPGTRSLVQVLKTTDTNFVDFISRCLEWVLLKSKINTFIIIVMDLNLILWNDVRPKKKDGIRHWEWRLKRRWSIRGSRSSRRRRWRTRDPNTGLDERLRRALSTRIRVIYLDFRFFFILNFWFNFFFFFIQ